MLRKFVLSNIRQAILYILLLAFINSLLIYFSETLIDSNRITTDNTISLLELLIQIMGLITTLLMGYFFFAFQLTENLKFNWYNSLKAETVKLENVIVNLPGKYSKLKPHLANVYELYNRRQLREYPITGSDSKVVEDLTKVLDEMKLKYSNLTAKDNTIDQAINILCNIEECASELAIIEIRSFLNKKLVNKIKKFFMLIVGTVLVNFILILLPNQLNKLILFNVSFFFVYYFIIMCLEIMFVINDYMRNVSWKRDFALQRVPKI